MSELKYSQYYYEIIERYKLLHTKGTKKLSGPDTFKGYSLSNWVSKIKEIINLHDCKSVIDYGCGKAYLYKIEIKVGDVKYNNLADFWKINNLILYDPAVKEYSKYPVVKTDGIICTDVIEHIPEEDVYKFIDEIFKLSKKFVFLVIAVFPATKYFDDGKNIHLCIKEKEEWDEIFLEFKRKYPNISQYIYFHK